MPFTENDWNHLPEPERSSLTFLRGLRDALARDIQREALSFGGDEDYEDDVREWVEDICRAQYYNSALAHLCNVFNAQQANTSPYADQAVLLVKVSLRIARLERQACGVPVRGQLATA